MSCREQARYYNSSNRGKRGNWHNSLLSDLALAHGGVKMSEKVITLPNHEDMQQRLLAVDDDERLQHEFYPHLLQHAGEEKVAQGVVMLLALAIFDFTNGMPPMMSGLMYMRANRYVDALVDDPEVADAAKRFLAEALKR